jgi:hypothetical protein
MRSIVTSISIKGLVGSHCTACWLFAVGLLLSGCSKPQVADGSSPAGFYTLASVNGAQVPTTVDHDGVKLQVRSGTFTINADGTCSSKVVFVPPSGAEAAREVKATYTREGSKLTMRWEGAGMNTGTTAGDTFTMNNEGMVFVYRK